MLLPITTKQKLCVHMVKSQKRKSKTEVSSWVGIQRLRVVFLSPLRSSFNAIISHLYKTIIYYCLGFKKFL